MEEGYFSRSNILLPGCMCQLCYKLIPCWNRELLRYIVSKAVTLFNNAIAAKILWMRRAINALNTFTAIIDLSRFNNSCLKSPVSTLVNLIFDLRSFSFNELCDLLLLAGNLYSSFSISSWRYPIHSLLSLHCDIMNCVYPYAERESGLSLAAVYKESFICEVMYMW